MLQRKWLRSRSVELSSSDFQVSGTMKLAFGLLPTAHKSRGSETLTAIFCPSSSMLERTGVFTDRVRPLRRAYQDVASGNRARNLPLAPALLIRRDVAQE